MNDLKCKIDISDIEELAAVPVDLIQLNNLIKDDAVKKYEYNVKIKNIEDEISDITKLATKTTLNAKKIEVKSKIHSFTNWPTSTGLITFENEIHNVSNLVTKTDYNIKINETEKS